MRRKALYESSTGGKPPARRGRACCRPGRHPGPGAAAGEGWHEVEGVSGTPSALAADRAGNVYVADAAKSRFTRIDLKGKARLFAKTGAVVRCLAFAGDVLYASLPRKEQIVRYDETCKEVVVHEKIAAVDLAARD